MSPRKRVAVSCPSESWPLISDVLQAKGWDCTADIREGADAALMMIVHPVTFVLHPIACPIVLCTHGDLGAAVKRLDQVLSMGVDDTIERISEEQTDERLATRH